MYFQKHFLSPLLIMVAAAILLSACQNNAPATATSTSVATSTPTEAVQAPTPEATAHVPSTPEPAATADSGKMIFPPKVTADFAVQDRPDSSVGNADAPLTMYEWCDYGYPKCATYNNEILPEITKKYVDTGKLKIVHKEFPAAGGDPSVVASMAAQCAAKQGQFKAMNDWLYKDNAWSTGDVPGTIAAVKAGAKDLSLNTDDFNACLDNQEMLESVKQDYFDARDLELRELPGIVIGGHVIQTGVDAQSLDTVIDALLQEQKTGSLPETVITVTPSPTPDTDFAPETVAVMGSPDAPVTITEFTDYQCPFCQRHASQTMPGLKEYIDSGKVRYILKNFPLTQIHPKAVIAGEAAECAGEQGKYWEMHDKLFENQKQWAESSDALKVFKGFAKELGLDEKAFETCVSSDRYKDKLMADQKEGVNAGVSGTPAFFINDQFLNGAQPLDVFKQIIDKILASGQ
ncbi:MAG: hypothetical protein DSY55_01335 [Clostridia bacterium]|nr:MAG: hypothetical protein DSY55_01335 [Clostridia bacterium]